MSVVASREVPGQDATIEMPREYGGLVDRLRSYPAVIDGAVVGRLHPAERLHSTSRLVGTSCGYPTDAYGRRPRLGLSG